MTADAADGRNRTSLLRRRRGWVVLTIAVIAAVAAVVIVIDSRAERVVDATTAAPTGIPAIPPVLGDKQFQLKLSNSKEQPKVVAAGPGFAVVVDNALTSYGADGSERWHYRPTDTAITDIHVYDGGAVLIAAVDDRDTLLAFDANTGRQLWSAQTKDLRAAFAGYENPEPEWDRTPTPLPSRFLAQSTGTQMIGFDPRSGEQIWQQSMGCADSGYTPTQMVCLNVFGDHVRAVVVDAATGARTAEWSASIPGAGRPETWTFLNPAVVGSAAGVAMTFWFSARSGEKFPSPVVYLNTTSGTSVPLADDGAVITGGDPQGAMLVSPLPGRSVPATALHGPDGAQRCVFSPDTVSDKSGYYDADTHDNRTAWLHEQIVRVVHRGTERVPEQSLGVFDRNCRHLAALPLPADTEITTIVPAPGVTIVVRNDNNGTHIDGYTPN